MQQQLHDTGDVPQAIVLEPVGRNTAPAVAVAALVALENAGKSGPDADPVLLILPADHVIRNVEAFREAVQQGLAAAAEGKLVTFGVVPNQPETGYGYIKRAGGKGPAYPVARFVEKPDQATAQKYVAAGDYYWNSGIFLFQARAYLAELGRHAPAMREACKQAVTKATRDLDFTRLPKAEFEACPSDSIDYAVMEKTNAAVVVPLDAGWSDVGSWSALQDALPTDENGNVTSGDVSTEGRAGADVVKVMVTGGVMSANDSPQHPQFSREELEVMVEEASYRGVSLMAHAHGAQGIKNALEAGIKSIEHGTFLDEECLDLLLEKDGWLVPTLLVNQHNQELAERGELPEFVAMEIP